MCTKDQNSSCFHRKFVSTRPYLVISNSFESFSQVWKKKKFSWQRHLYCGSLCSLTTPQCVSSFCRIGRFSSTCWVCVAVCDRWPQSPQAVNPRGKATCVFLVFLSIKSSSGFSGGKRSGEKKENKIHVVIKSWVKLLKQNSFPSTVWRLIFQWLCPVCWTFK